MRSMLSMLLALSCTTAAAQLPVPFKPPLPWQNGSYAAMGITFGCVGSYPGAELGGWAGYTLTANGMQPVVGQTFYSHIVLYSYNAACGGSQFDVTMELPPDVWPATAANSPSHCFLRDTYAPAPFLLDLGQEPLFGCPSFPPPFFPPDLTRLRISPPNGGIGGRWLMWSSGQAVELMIPLRATAAQWGNSAIRFHVRLLDGTTGTFSVPLEVVVPPPPPPFSWPGYGVLMPEVCQFVPTAAGC